MKRIIVSVAVAAVAACSQPAPAPEATAEATAEPTVAVAEGPMAADGKGPVGSFKITTHDGKTIMEEVKADGTYSDTMDGKVVETGKWEQKSPTEYCFTKDEAGAKQECNKEGVDAKGVWTSTNAKGETATVVRL